MKQLYTISLLFCLFGDAYGQIQDSIRLENVTLHYSMYGKGKPLLLLSGGPGNSANNLQEVANMLSNRYMCILFEQRGTGQSITHPMDSTTINLDQAVADINTLKKKLQLNKLTIIGHSWGAMFAMYYASKYADNIEKLVLVGPGPLSFDSDVTSDNRTARASIIQREFMKAARDSINKNIATEKTQRTFVQLIWRLSLYDAYKADSIIQILGKTTRNQKMQDLMMSDMRKKYDVRKNVADFKMPVLVICGRQDPVGVFPAFAIKELNKQSTICWIEKSGHFPFLEQPEAFQKCLYEFIK
jgi:proline iminopeptidase